MRSFIFVLNIFLIILIISSCSEDNFKPEDVKAKFNNFNPDSAYSGDTITLNGKNLLQSSLLKIYLDSFETEIISKSETSIKFKIPDIEAGNYNCKIITDTTSFTFSNQLKVLYKPTLFDSISYFEVSFNLHVLMKHYYDVTIYPNNNSNTEYNIDSDASASYNSKDTKLPKSMINDTLSYYYRTFKNDIGVKIVKNSIDKTIKYLSVIKWIVRSKDTEKFTSFHLIINNAKYVILDNCIIIEVNASDIDLILKKLNYFSAYYDWHSHTNIIDEWTVTKILPAKETSYFRIKLFK